MIIDNISGYVATLPEVNLGSGGQTYYEAATRYYAYAHGYGGLGAHALVNSFANYLGTSDALEKFKLLNLDADLKNGDIETPLIKMPLRMPEYYQGKNNYLDALRSRCRAQFGKDISFYPGDNLPLTD